MSKERHVCKICCKSLSSQQHLARHVKFHSRKRTAHYRCKKCDVKVELINDFHLHMKTVHPKKLKVSKIKELTQSSHKCKNCEYSSRLKKDIVIHMKSHNNSVKDNPKHSKRPDDVPHPCDKCSKSFTRRKLLRQHMKFHGDFSCMKCFETFSLKSQLLSLTHFCNTIQNANCTLCGKSFRLKSELKRHVRAFHLKERLFKCKECPKAYTDPTPLKHHKNATHGDGSTFSNCIQCKKTFTTKRRYLEHAQKYH